MIQRYKFTSKKDLHLHIWKYNPKESYIVQPMIQQVDANLLIKLYINFNAIYL